MRLFKFNAVSILAMIGAVGTAFTPISLGNIFVAYNGTMGTVGEYTNLGVAVNPSLTPSPQCYGVAVSGSSLFICNLNGTVDEYTTSGAPVSVPLISVPGGGELTAIAISGSNIFVQNWSNGTVGEYTTSGAVVNASLISGLGNGRGIAISGDDLFVASETNHNIGEYTTSGAVVNASLISGFSPENIAVSGSDLFVAETGLGTIDEFTASGVPVSVPLISGLGSPQGLAISGSDIYETSYSSASPVGEYTTSGATVNVNLISFNYASALLTPDGIAVTTDVPEPTSLSLLFLGGGMSLHRRRRAKHDF